jgi:hypothetical protein
VAALNLERVVKAVAPAVVSKMRCVVGNHRKAKLVKSLRIDCATPSLKPRLAIPLQQVCARIARARGALAALAIGIIDARMTVRRLADTIDGTAVDALTELARIDSKGPRVANVTIGLALASIALNARRTAKGVKANRCANALTVGSARLAVVDSARHVQWWFLAEASTADAHDNDKASL